jgi:hypothetical protein
MARRRLFNRNQPRDSRGRWTSGGGASRGARRRANRRTLTPAQQRNKTRRLNSFNRVAGGTLAGAYVGTLAMPGTGTLAGAFVGAAVSTRRKKRKKR